MENQGGATKVSAVFQLVTALVAFFTGSFAILETLPTPPLFDLHFISNTRPTLAGAGMASGAVGLLLIPLTFRAPGRWQWVLVISIVLAVVGFCSGLLAGTMTSWAG